VPSAPTGGNNKLVRNKEANIENIAAKLFRNLNVKYPIRINLKSSLITKIKIKYLQLIRRKKEVKKPKIYVKKIDKFILRRFRITYIDFAKNV